MYEIDEQKVFLQGEHPTHIHSTCTTLSQENATDIQIAVTRITVRIITHLVAFKKIHGTVSEMKTGQNCCKESEMSGMKTSHSVQSWFVAKVATIGTHAHTVKHGNSQWHPIQRNSTLQQNESFCPTRCMLPPHPLLSVLLSTSTLVPLEVFRSQVLSPCVTEHLGGNHHALAQDFLN